MRSQLPEGRPMPERTMTSHSPLRRRSPAEAAASGYPGWRSRDPGSKASHPDPLQPRELTRCNLDGLYCGHRCRIARAGAARCVFSESMQDNALRIASGSPPGAPPGVLHHRIPGGVPGGVVEWRAVVRVLRSPARGLRGVFDDLVTTVFPDDCRACGGPLLRSGFAPVCDVCVSQIPSQSERFPLALCVCCGEA